MKRIELTIKPTLFCNIKCKHCFYGKMTQCREMLNIEVAKELIIKTSKNYKFIKVTFHGGEPTLVGLDFYKEFFNLEKQLIKNQGIHFDNFFTTNGILLNDNFIDLLISNNTLINISFDGPYNHLLRTNTDTVFKNIKKIQEKKGRFRCYCVICNDSVRHLNEIYDWFNDQNFDFKTAPIEPLGNAISNQNLMISTKELADAFIDIYKRWIFDKDFKVKYYTLMEFAKFDRETQFKPFWFNKNLALNPNGIIYPFGRPNDVIYELGNPFNIDNIDDCFNSENYLKMLSTINGYFESRCNTCKSKGVCNGVSIAMSYMYNNNDDYLYRCCEQANSLFQSILKINDSIKNDIRNKKIEKYNSFILKQYIERN